MSFVLGTLLCVFLVGRLDARLPWPAPAAKREGGAS